MKLKARRKCDALQKKLFADSAGMSYGAQVTFKSIPDGSVESSCKDNVLCTAYSREWVKENQDFPTLLNNFIYLFEYVDKRRRGVNLWQHRETHAVGLVWPVIWVLTNYDNFDVFKGRVFQCVENIVHIRIDRVTPIFFCKKTAKSKIAFAFKIIA
jgi:hypothetical protein